ncbi:MAG: flavin reductase family protein [Ignavibacteriales bacterium]
MNTKVLHKISYGMYIVSSEMDGKFNGQVANTVIQISSEPATIAVSINKQNLTHEYISNSKKFSISILSEETPMTFFGTFGFKSGRDIDKFKEINYKIGQTGIPIVLDYSIGYIETELINKIDVETHTIFIGKIIDAEVTGEENPMTYDFYHKVRKGLAPKAAPTYIKPV